MDEIFKTAIDLIPFSWRPYVGLGLLILYFVTKIRSMFKSQQIEDINKVRQTSFRMHYTLLTKIIDILF